MSTAQIVANNYTEVATKTAALIATLGVITNVYAISIEQFGTDKWLILIVYD